MAVLAVGSDLRGDDGAALLVAEHLENKRATRPGKRGTRGGKSGAIPQKPLTPRTLEIFLGHSAPENLTGEIKKYQPTHLVIIDTADTRSAPGAVVVFNASDIATENSFCTHSLPLAVMVQYLRHFITCEVTVIGIQPRNIGFGKPLSPVVRRAAARIATALHAVVAP